MALSNSKLYRRAAPIGPPGSLNDSVFRWPEEWRAEDEKMDAVTKQNDGEPERSENGARILIADDNRECREALRFLLEARGYTVYEASDGESAVRLARRTQPDLILMDIMMPGVNGLEATRRIRDERRIRKTRVVAVSGMRGARQASVLAGCDDCMTKPVKMSGLDDLVDRWIAPG